MDPLSWAIIGGLCLGTGVATYFITKHSAGGHAEMMQDAINNQIIIKEEQDKSKEFAQWVVIAILIILVTAALIFGCVKCIVNSVINSRLRAVGQRHNNNNGNNDGVLDI